MSKRIDQTEIRRRAIMWAEIIRLQVSRLQDAVGGYHHALTAELLRAVLPTDRPTAIRAEIESQLPQSLTEQDAITLLAADRYFLLLAVRQLLKCVEDLPADGLPTLDDADLLRNLRNLEEHWNEPSGRSVTALRELIPDIEPGRLRYDQEDIFLEGVLVADVLQWSESVKWGLRSAEADPVPLEGSG